jgi:hypothetical protein
MLILKMSPTLLVVAVQVNQLCQHLPTNDGVNLTARKCCSYWEFPAFCVIFNGFARQLLGQRRF